MASAKEIQERIRSVQDTMKITNAMYMISSSKMKRAKKILAETEPYYFGVQSSIARILRHVPEIEHKYFDQRSDISQKDRKIGVIVISADKGLAGAYNHNIFKEVESMLEEPGQYRLYVLGIVGQQYFAKKDVIVDANVHYTVQKPTIHRARSLASTVVGAYLRKELDEIRIVFTEMINAVTVETKVQQLLPLKRVQFTGKLPVDLYVEDVAMVPSVEVVLDNIVPNYIVGMIYGCLVESYASEHNARMLAMQSSTDSAKDMLRQLEIQYNRARQAAITQEITEVIGGAKALKRK